MPATKKTTRTKTAKGKGEASPTENKGKTVEATKVTEGSYPKGSKFILNIRTGAVHCVTSAVARYNLTKHAWLWRPATKQQYETFEKWLSEGGERPVFAVDDADEE